MLKKTFLSWLLFFLIAAASAQHAGIYVNLKEEVAPVPEFLALHTAIKFRGDSVFSCTKSFQTTVLEPGKLHAFISSMAEHYAGFKGQQVMISYVGDLVLQPGISSKVFLMNEQGDPDVVNQLMLLVNENGKKVTSVMVLSRYLFHLAGDLSFSRLNPNLAITCGKGKPSDINRKAVPGKDKKEVGEKKPATLTVKLNARGAFRKVKT